MTMKFLDDHIEITPGICSGKPRIAGHLITVAHIAIWHERLGKCADEIATEYDLTLADVYAALAYYFDHREELTNQFKRVKNLRRLCARRCRLVWVLWPGRLKSPTTSIAWAILRYSTSAGRKCHAAYHRRPSSPLSWPHPGGLIKIQADATEIG